MKTAVPIGLPKTVKKKLYQELKRYKVFIGSVKSFLSNVLLELLVYKMLEKRPLLTKFGMLRVKRAILAILMTLNRIKSRKSC